MTKPQNKTTKERILEEFKKVRTDAISVMFDNPNESGIYPTTDFFNTLDNWLSQKLDELERDIREQMVAIGEELLEELQSRYRGGEGDMPSVFYEGKEEAITAYQQKIKILNS